MATKRFSEWRKRWLPSLPLAAAVFCFWLLMNDQVTRGHVLMALVLSVLLTIFSVAVFSYGLGLPFERFGPWLRF